MVRAGARPARRRPATRSTPRSAPATSPRSSPTRAASTKPSRCSSTRCAIWQAAGYRGGVGFATMHLGRIAARAGRHRAGGRSPRPSPRGLRGDRGRHRHPRDRRRRGGGRPPRPPARAGARAVRRTRSHARPPPGVPRVHGAALRRVRGEAYLLLGRLDQARGRARAQPRGRPREQHGLRSRARRSRCSSAWRVRGGTTTRHRGVRGVACDPRTPRRARSRVDPPGNRGGPDTSLSGETRARRWLRPPKVHDRVTLQVHVAEVLTDGAAGPAASAPGSAGTPAADDRCCRS